MSKVIVGNVYQSLGDYGMYEVVYYKGAFMVGIRFIDTGYEVEVTAGSVRNGTVKDYLKPEVWGVGYNSLGRLRGISGNHKLKRARNLWNKMLERCYSEVKLLANPTYRGCSVCVEWHDFANYWEWYDRVCDTEVKNTFHVDKDLVFKGNKVYSPTTCYLVPRLINNLLPSLQSTKETSLPVGVHYHKSHGSYQAYCNNFKQERVSLGFHNTPEGAYRAYKKFKKGVLVECANHYKEYIHKDLYDTLTNYEFNYEEK